MLAGRRKIQLFQECKRSITQYERFVSAKQFFVARFPPEIGPTVSAWKEQSENQQEYELRLLRLRKLAFTLQHLGKWSRGNEIKTMFDGYEVFPRMWKSMALAQKRVWLEVYKLGMDDVGGKTMSELMSAKKRGCDVRLIYDPIGSLDLSYDVIDELIYSGITVQEFNPFDHKVKRHKVLGWGPLMVRNHRKVLVCDDVAYLGGMNHSEEYYRTWRDNNVEIRGPIVDDLILMMETTGMLRQHNRGLLLKAKGMEHLLTKEEWEEERKQRITPEWRKKTVKVDIPELESFLLREEEKRRKKERKFYQKASMFIQPERKKKWTLVKKGPPKSMQTSSIVHSSHNRYVPRSPGSVDLSSTKLQREISQLLTAGKSKIKRKYFHETPRSIYDISPPHTLTKAHIEISPVSHVSPEFPAKVITQEPPGTETPPLHTTLDPVDTSPELVSVSLNMQAEMQISDTIISSSAAISQSLSPLDSFSTTATSFSKSLQFSDTSAVSKVQPHQQTIAEIKNETAQIVSRMSEKESQYPDPLDVSDSANIPEAPISTKVDNSLSAVQSVPNTDASKTLPRLREKYMRTPGRLLSFISKVRAKFAKLVSSDSMRKRADDSVSTVFPETEPQEDGAKQLAKSAMIPTPKKRKWRERLNQRWIRAKSMLGVSLTRKENNLEATSTVVIEASATNIDEANIANPNVTVQKDYVQMTTVAKSEASAGPSTRTKNLLSNTEPLHISSSQELSLEMSQLLTSARRTDRPKFRFWFRLNLFKSPPITSPATTSAPAPQLKHTKWFSLPNTAKNILARTRPSFLSQTRPTYAPLKETREDATSKSEPEKEFSKEGLYNYLKSVRSMLSRRLSLLEEDKQPTKTEKLPLLLKVKKEVSEEELKIEENQYKRMDPYSLEDEMAKFPIPARFFPRPVSIELPEPVKKLLAKYKKGNIPYTAENILGTLSKIRDGSYAPVSLADLLSKKKKPSPEDRYNLDIKYELQNPMVEVLPASYYDYVPDDEDSEESFLHGRTLYRRIIPSGTLQTKIPETPIPTDEVFAKAAVVDLSKAKPDDTLSMVLTSNSSIGKMDIQKALVETLRLAERRIYISSPYFLPPYEILRELLFAGERGVDVQILTSGPCDVASLKLATEHLIPSLLDSGIKVFEFTGGILHAKAWIVDGYVTYIGSFNTDYTSQRNVELMLIMMDTAKAEQFETQFKTDLLDAKEMKLNEMVNTSCFYKTINRWAYGVHTFPYEDYW